MSCRRPQPTPVTGVAFANLLTHPQSAPLVHVRRQPIPTAFPNPWLTNYRQKLLAKENRSGSVCNTAEVEKLNAELVKIRRELSLAKAEAKERKKNQEEYSKNLGVQQRQIVGAEERSFKLEISDLTEEVESLQDKVEALEQQLEVAKKSARG